MVIEYKGERYSVIGESDTNYFATKPWDEEEGEAFHIPKSESKIISHKKFDPDRGPFPKTENKFAQQRGKKMRNWLIKKLAGKRTVLINAHIKDGVVLIKPNQQAIIHNCITRMRKI